MGQTMEDERMTTTMADMALGKPAIGKVNTL